MPAWTSPSTFDRPHVGSAAGQPPTHPGIGHPRRRHGDARGRTRWPHRWSGALFALCAAPAAWLVWRLLARQLGADPLQAALHTTGWWALSLLLVTLCVTPVRRFSAWLSRTAAARWGRRWSDWNHLIRLRRQLGLWSFAYACAHLALYAVLDAGSLHELLADVTERPFIAWGGASWLMLLPLAATSNRPALRWLKQRWALLHLLAYPAALAGLLHDALQAKLADELPFGMLAAAALLLAARLWAWRRGDRVPARVAEAAVAGGPQRRADGTARRASPRAGDGAA